MPETVAKTPAAPQAAPITPQQDYENLKTIVAFLNRTVFAGYNSDDPKALPTDPDLLALLAFIRGHGQVIATSEDENIISAFRESYNRQKVKLQDSIRNINK